MSYKELMEYPLVMTPDCPFIEEIYKNDGYKSFIVDDEIISLPIIERGEAIGILAGVSQYDFGPHVVAIPIREECYRTIGISSCKGKELSYVAKEFRSMLKRTANDFYK